MFMDFLDRPAPNLPQIVGLETSQHPLESREGKSVFDCLGTSVMN
jgi:hypothetical protein